LGRLYIKHQDIGLQGEPHLLAGLAYSRKDDPARRDAGPHGTIQLPTRHDIGSASEVGEELQGRDVGVRLHRKADQVGDVGERLVKDLEVVRECRVAIQIERGANLLGYPLDRHLFAHKMIIAILEMMHAALSS